VTTSHPPSEALHESDRAREELAVTLVVLVLFLAAVALLAPVFPDFFP
jgi:hypothetical protein